MPFTTWLTLIVLWVVVSLPLVLIGAYIGERQTRIEQPVRVSPVPRLIPYKPWYMSDWIRYGTYYKAHKITVINRLIVQYGSRWCIALRSSIYGSAFLTQVHLAGTDVWVILLPRDCQSLTCHHYC
jgi:hypothetical protein